MYESLNVCKRDHDTEETPTTGFWFKKKTKLTC